MNKGMYRIGALLLAVMLLAGGLSGAAAEAPGAETETPVETEVSGTAEESAEAETPAEGEAPAAEEPAEAEAPAEAADAAWPGETETVRTGMFTLPVPTGLTATEPVQISDREGLMERFSWMNEDGTRAVFADVSSYKKIFYVNTENIRSIYTTLTEKMENVLWQEEVMLDEKHPALVTATLELIEPAEGEEGEAACEQQITLLYFFGSSMLTLTYGGREPAEAMTDESLQPKKDDWLALLGQVSYSTPENREGLPEWLVTLDSFVCNIYGKDGQLGVASGKTLQIYAELAEEKLVKAMNANAKKVYWVLADTAVMALTGQLTPPDESVATISSSGVLKGGNVDKITAVTVVALNQTSENVTWSTFLVFPAQKSLTLSEQKADLYVGESAPMTLVVTAEPEESLAFGAGYTNIVWSVDKPDLLELKDSGAGAVTLTALAPGKATVTVKDTVSGKSAKAVFTLLTPVTAVEIDGPDTLAPGKGAQYKAVLTPEKPSSKKVTWTLEAGEEYATLSKEGKLTVKKDAPEGTEIVISCRAEGSSEERTDRKVVTVQAAQ